MCAKGDQPLLSWRCTPDFRGVLPAVGGRAHNEVRLPAPGGIDERGSAVPKEDLKDLPGTIRRSLRKAQETYAKTLESAHEQYGGDEERAHRTAYASLKHKLA